MDLERAIRENDYLLTEAAVIESLRRSGEVELHPQLANALLIYDERGRKALSALYRSYTAVARRANVPIVMGAPTWRANRERLAASRIDSDVNGDAVRFMKELRGAYGEWAGNIYVCGLIGCRNDCYRPEQGLSRGEAEAFHEWQIERLAAAGVDALMAVTLPAVEEAAGIARAMSATEVPYIISFVIDRMGRILDGTSLEVAFDIIDASTGSPPLGYMINCSHPSFLGPRKQRASVMSRLIGYQANSSPLDHSELDGAPVLHAGDVSEWGGLMIQLNREYGVKILGGCCGTGIEHLEYLVEHIRGNT
jgi:homocysteine S-methyltransferase